MTSMSTLTFLSLIYLINVVVGDKETSDALHYIFLLNPSYGLASGLSDIYYNHVVSNACKESSTSLAACQHENINFFEHPFETSRPGIGATVAYLLIEGIVFALLTILIEHRDNILQYFMRKKAWTLRKHHEQALRKGAKISRNARSQSMYSRPRSAAVVQRNSGSNHWLSRSMSMSQTQNKVGLKRSFTRVEEDKSVKQERRNIDSLLRKTIRKELESENSLVLSRVSKQYHTGLWKRIKDDWTQEEPPLPAVGDVNLKVAKNECFGLAGFNGAGKTTIFKILTGDIQCTTGVATICGFNIRFESINYCSQSSLHS